MVCPETSYASPRLKNPRGENLYDFWGDTISENIQDALAERKHPWIINLASNEYFKSVKAGKIKARVISPPKKMANP